MIFLCMRLVIESPTRAYIDGELTAGELVSLEKQLTYTNTSVQYLIRRHYKNHFFKSNNKVGWERRLGELESELKKTLIFNDGTRTYIRPGSIPYLKDLNVEVVNKVVYPQPKKVAWAKTLPFTLHYYQNESAVKLPEVKHGNVELCTGAGKSAILLQIAREMGLPGAIVAPSRSIFEELVEKFEHHFGKGNVGKFGDGKKKLGKRFTICIADSLCNIKKDTPEWEFFSKLSWMGIDESHTWGAETLEGVCHGVLAEVPYRFFFSGTQTRGDGTEKLLQSLIGRTVCTLTTADAVKQGFIAKHRYKIVRIESSNPNMSSADPLQSKRIHFLGNKNIAAFYAKLANSMATAFGKQTLILVEELSQIAALVKLLKVPYAYAHSESNAARLAELGLSKVDPADSVEKFNKNEVKVLIGTSCIATGTNIFPVHNCCNWVGGTSEIKTKQGVIGRSVRHGSSNPYAHLCVPKDEAVIWDIDVYDNEHMRHQFKDRLSCYEESGTTIEYVKLQ